jgi:hypothetical protein
VKPGRIPPVTAGDEAGAYERRCRRAGLPMFVAIDEAARESWLGPDQFNVLVAIDLGGDHFELTEELVRVAGGLAGFSGFYFAVAMLTHSTYREEFLAELTDEMSTTFRDRVDYLRLRGAEA